MTIRGVRGIAIAYVRRDYLIKADVAKGINITEYSDFHDIDPQVPLKYECVAVHLSLTDIESLDQIYLTEGSTRFVEEARKYPPPFRNLLRISSRSPLEHISLDEAFGVPYLAVVKRPHRIMFKNLTGGKVSILMCPTYAPFHHRAHTIKAIRIIPYMNRILAVREVDAERTAFNRDPIYVVEMYDIIPSGPVQTEQLVQPVDRGKISMNGVWTHIYISDPGVPPSEDDSILPRLRKKSAEPPKPLPISVFAIRTRDDGIVRLTLYPSASCTSSRPRRPRTRRTPPAPYHAGASRTDTPLECGVPRPSGRPAPAAVRGALGRHPERAARGEHACPARRGDAPALGAARGLARLQGGRWLYGRLGAPPPEFEAEAFAWDDTIGRLCVALASSMKVQVYDFARAPRTDGNGQRMPVPLLLHPNPDRVVPHDERSNGRDAMDCA
ncbi:hypothetical protein A0H81_00014 [Grifola frondosa]|uniref:Uncharacterized protein n=1 Tax=Grifola frondosa TaxID=5627 RepID=A0A1C7MRP4_GRIFR|nr:hypothetical protein A0H81_00014 [Grifola frondosa]